MQKTMTTRMELKLVGITTRTNNAQVFGSDPSVNKIAVLAQKYFNNGLAEKIKDRKNPGTTFCAYTHYESDVNGHYTCFIGEEVSSFESVDQEFEMLTIPDQNYAKFTNQPGPMPDACIDMWQNIWKMDVSDLGGERAYVADFEIYDERSRDYNNVTLDIYIGIKK
ncbi:MAG: AraC family transcriptional regulator [Myxococcaceae bacterium]|nr:AraC family transcriptional regulator [Myxococcaceae bacterium]MBH2006581.1 AraC family transcriptional regulator [Myxococcaceae bacterium]